MDHLGIGVTIEVKWFGTRTCPVMTVTMSLCALKSPVVVNVARSPPLSYWLNVWFPELVSFLVFNTKHSILKLHVFLVLCESFEVPAELWTALLLANNSTMQFSLHLCVHMGSSFVSNETGSVHKNVTWSCVHATIVAVAMQNALHFLRLCL